MEENTLNANKLEINQWLDHIQLILHGVATTVHYVNDLKKTGTDTILENELTPNLVLVHCSDGWDRTPQLTGTTMLCLDPYYRTLEGFQVLIEKVRFCFVFFRLYLFAFYRFLI